MGDKTRNADCGRTMKEFKCNTFFSVVIIESWNVLTGGISDQAEVS